MVQWEQDSVPESVRFVLLFHTDIECDVVAQNDVIVTQSVKTLLTHNHCQFWNCVCFFN
jgi:hypothetical protein